VEKRGDLGFNSLLLLTSFTNISNIGTFMSFDTK